MVSLDLALSQTGNSETPSAQVRAGLCLGRAPGSRSPEESLGLKRSHREVEGREVHTKCEKVAPKVGKSFRFPLNLRYFEKRWIGVCLYCLYSSSAMKSRVTNF